MLESNSVEEDLFAAYVEADFDGELMGLWFSGNIGVRGVFTRTGSLGTLLENSPETGFEERVTPYAARNEFTEFLPSLNLSFPIPGRTGDPGGPGQGDRPSSPVRSGRRSACV